MAEPLDGAEESGAGAVGAFAEFGEFASLVDESELLLLLQPNKAMDRQRPSVIVAKGERIKTSVQKLLTRKQWWRDMRG
jgi:hypothetical protein